MRLLTRKQKQQQRRHRTTRPLRGGCAYQLLADGVRRAQLQPLPKRCTKELRSWRARPGRLLERPASRGLLPQPSAGCQSSPRRPFCCHVGHQRFVSDDMSTGSTTPRPYDRRLIDRPTVESELGGPLAGCTTSTRGRPLENLCILTKPDSILQSVRFLPVFVGARRKIRCPRPARQALLR